MHAFLEWTYTFLLVFLQRACMFLFPYHLVFATIPSSLDRTAACGCKTYMCRFVQFVQFVLSCAPAPIGKRVQLCASIHASERYVSFALIIVSMWFVRTSGGLIAPTMFLLCSCVLQNHCFLNRFQRGSQNLRQWWSCRINLGCHDAASCHRGRQLVGGRSFRAGCKKLGKQKYQVRRQGSALLHSLLPYISQ